MRLGDACERFVRDVCLAVRDVFSLCSRFAAGWFQVVVSPLCWTHAGLADGPSWFAPGESSCGRRDAVLSLGRDRAARVLSFPWCGLGAPVSLGMFVPFKAVASAGLATRTPPCFLLRPGGSVAVSPPRSAILSIGLLSPVFGTAQLGGCRLCRSCLFSQFIDLLS